MISTHALREEGDALSVGLFSVCTISTHALREEGDGDILRVSLHPNYFYPRPPRGGRPDGLVVADGPVAGNFYPRPPRGGRQHPQNGRIYRRPISTHALREEGDKQRTPPKPNQKKFLPTPSARRATPPDDA